MSRIQRDAISDKELTFILLKQHSAQLCNSGGITCCPLQQDYQKEKEKNIQHAWSRTYEQSPK